MIRIALTKGRIEKQVCKMLEKAGYNIQPIINKNRELLIKCEEFEVIFGKSNDVLTFVEHGIVDVGFVGKDTLDESEYDDYYEMLDLEIGKCYFAVCGYPDYKTTNFINRKRIATKYTNVAKEYFSKKKEDVDVIKLEGSVELGPIVGLSDAIVDIVETGSTLKANGLEVIEKISDISTKLIVNKASLKFNKEPIIEMIQKLENSKEDAIC